ncbi:MAG TPA: TolC family protein [Flavobacteriaceae bacterium]|nr:TolC family protein [Flavobacteriaceae bacterium]
MKKSILFFILILFGLKVNAQEQQAWTLQECIEHAMEHNISIKQSELDLEMTEIDKNMAIGNYLPGINGFATNSWNTGLTQNVTTGVLQNQTTRNFSAGVTLDLTLFSGLRNLRQLQRAKLSGLAAQYSLEQMQDDIALFVANSYLQVLVNKETLKVLEEQHLVTLDQLDRTQKLVDQGVAPQGDLLQIKALSAEEEQQIITAENAVHLSLVSLAQTLLIEDYENFDIAEREYEVRPNAIMSRSVDEIIKFAMEERAEVKIAEKNVELAQKDVQISRAAYYPTLSGFFNYNTRESGAERITQGEIDPDFPSRPIGYVESTGEVVVAPNFKVNTLPPLPFFEQLYMFDGISYGFQLNVPIFNGLSTRNTVKRQKVNVMRAEYQLEQAKLDLESNVYQAFVDAKGAAKAYDAAKVALEAQQLAFKYAQERYDVGLTNAFELRQAQFELTNSESKLIQAKYDYIFKVKVLELYFGVPVDQIRL